VGTVPRKIETAVAADEYDRIGKELNAVTWIRNSRSIYQLREFVVDFWNNTSTRPPGGFYATAALPVYDLTVIRPRAFGNFHDLLSAVATSASMLRYLDNASSTAAHPTRTTPAKSWSCIPWAARPIWASGKPGAKSRKPGDIAAGFSDQDIIQASRALSGWTLEQGQDGPKWPTALHRQVRLQPQRSTPHRRRVHGRRPLQARGQAQGQTVLQVIANHPATADFICT